MTRLTMQKWKLRLLGSCSTVKGLAAAANTLHNQRSPVMLVQLLEPVFSVTDEPTY